MTATLSRLTKSSSGSCGGLTLSVSAESEARLVARPTRPPCSLCTDVSLDRLYDATQLFLSWCDNPPARLVTAYLPGVRLPVRAAGLPLVAPALLPPVPHPLHSLRSQHTLHSFFVGSKGALRREGKLY